MSITVHEALHLPVMTHTKLVAGQEGIHNIIKWVTIVEVIEDINRLQEGEFLITTGYGLNETNEQFKQLLSHRKLSGIAIYTGFYLDEIPATFKKIANESDMPLIEIPTTINFSTITKGILQEMINQQMQVISSSLNIHKQLTGLMLKNRGEHAISDTLSNLIEASIFIINEYEEFSHSVQKHEHLMDDVNHILEHLKHHIQKGKKTRQPQYVEMLGFKIIIYPIIANEKYYGSIIALKKLEAWAEIDLNAIEHGATVYAIEYLQKDTVEQTQIRLRGEFLEEVIHRNFKSSSLALDRGQKLGYDLSIEQCVLHINFRDLKDSEQLKQAVSELYGHTLSILEQQNRQFIMRERLNSLIVLSEVKPTQKKSAKKDSLDLARLIMDTYHNKYPNRSILIGVGKTYEDVDQLSQSAMEAKYAVDLSDLLLLKKNIIHYDDLGTFHLLLQMMEMGADLHQFYEVHLGDLLQSSKQGIDLLYTLEIYFKNNLNSQTTSSELFVHRHTLKYRLNKIEERSGYNLHSADDRLKLQLAIAAYKLDQYYK